METCFYRRIILGIWIYEYIYRNSHPFNNFCKRYNNNISYKRHIIGSLFNYSTTGPNFNECYICWWYIYIVLFLLTIFTCGQNVNASYLATARAPRSNRFSLVAAGLSRNDRVKCTGKLTLENAYIYIYKSKNVFFYRNKMAFGLFVWVNRRKNEHLPRYFLYSYLCV